MAKRKRIRYSEEPEETLRARPRRTRKFMRRLGLLLLLLVGLLAAAPTIVGKTTLRNTLLAKALPGGWNIESRQATLGWASNQTLTDVTIVDAKGKQLLTVESVTLPRSLLSLAINQADLGKLEVVRPTAYLETWPDGSNWEDFLFAIQNQIAEQQQQPPASSPDATNLTLEIVDGTVHGIDRATGRGWSLEAANVTAVLGAAKQANGSAQLVTVQPAQRGQVQFRWQPQDAEGQQLELLAERLPLGPLEPWLARALPGAELTGALSADAQFNWTVDSQRGLVLQTAGRLEAGQLDFSAEMLQGDRLRCQKVNAPWKLRLADEQLTVEQLEVDADWAQLKGNGSLTLEELKTLSFEDLPKQVTQLAGQVDLARLATMLPRTLQLRQGVRIDSGQLEFSAAGLAVGERLVWQAKATLRDVAGSDRQRQIRWQQPIEATARLNLMPAGPLLEEVTLSAPFIQASLNTEVTAEEDVLDGKFEIDLAQFSQELGQFVDLSSWQLRGLGEGTLELQRQPNQQFAATAEVDFTDLHVVDAGRTLWTEPKLNVGFFAIGTEQDFTPSSLKMGKVQLRGPRDQWELELLEPIALNAKQQPWQVRVDGNGPLELWLGRLRPWLDKVPERLAGEAQLHAILRIAPHHVGVSKLAGNVQQLRVQGEGFAIDEPQVQISGDIDRDRQTGSLQTQELQLLGSSFSLRAREVAVALAAPGAPTARGSVAFRADLERLAAMAGLVGPSQASQSTSTWPRGTAVGQLKLTSSAEQLAANFGVKVEQMELVRMTAANGAVYGRPEIVWREPQLEATGVAKYVVAADRVQFDNLQIRGKTLRLNSSASVDQIRTAGQLQASGLLEYDPNELAKLLTSYAGEAVQLQGDQQVRFQVAGSLFDSAAAHWSQRWNASAEAGWSSAGAYGLSLGGGRLQAALRGGQMQIAPLDIAIGQGRLTAQPQVRLTPGAEQIVLSKGPLVTNVAISPEVSETMLKYVAPILAGATRTEGQFSVDLDQAEIMLGRPEQSRVQGRLAVHRLNVSPGPMTNQLITLVSQIEALTKRKQFLQAATSPSNKKLLTVAERQVDFQVVDGRVYHRNLEFLIDNVPVRSYGSVGFDQTLALVIEVPIQDKWIEREPALRSFAGQSLKIPIYGTFQKPRIDERAVADLSKQLLQGAATQVIGDELNRQFDKLFGR